MTHLNFGTRSRGFLVHGCLALLALVTLLPLWAMLVSGMSAGGGEIGFSSLLPEVGRLTFTNLTDVWTEGNFGVYFLNSLIVTVVVTVANLLFDSMAAYALAKRNFSGKKLIFGLIMIKLMVPATVLMAPTFILIKAIGLYDSYGALILPMVAETFGIFLLRQYMLGLPVELEEAARLEGAGDFRIFFTIILPLSKPALAVVAIHSVLINWNAYLFPLILTATDSMRTLPLGIAFYRASHSGVDRAHMMAGSLIASLPVILVFLFFQRRIIAGLTQGGVKG